MRQVMHALRKVALPALFSTIGMSAGAQSSVTIFGVADATISRGIGSVTNWKGVNQNGLSANRLGFRGREDLGGGLAASFWLEAGYNIDTGSGLATNTNNQASGAQGAGAGLNWNRRSTVSLHSPFGEIRAGRDFNPQYHNLYLGDAFVNNGVGAAVNFTAIITGVTSQRSSNMVQYYSPVFGGFSVQGSVYAGESQAGTPTAGDGNGHSVRIAYDGQMLSAGIATGETRYQVGDVHQSNAYVRYDPGFGRFLAMYSYDRNGTLRARGGGLAALVTVGRGEIRAGYNVYRTDANGDPQVQKVALGYVYPMSRRTHLYSVAARVKNSGGSARALNFSTTAPNQSSTGFDLGVRHVF